MPIEIRTTQLNENHYDVHIAKFIASISYTNFGRNVHNAKLDSYWETRKKKKKNNVISNNWNKFLSLRNLTLQNKYVSYGNYHSHS